jgi:outer membrane protein assembly factor BamB
MRKTDLCSLMRLMSVAVAALLLLLPAIAREDREEQEAPTAAEPPAPAGEVPAPPVPTAAGSGPTDIWTTLKGDPQRTGASDVRLPLPLNLVWRHTTDVTPGMNPSSPLVVGPLGARRVYFSAASSVFGVDAQTGEQIWRTDLPAVVKAPLTLSSGGAEDLVLVLTSRGMFALRTSDGGQAWTAKVSTPASVTPTLINTASGGRIIVGTTRGRLLAFTTDGKPDPDWEVNLGEGVVPTSAPS